MKWRVDFLSKPTMSEDEKKKAVLANAAREKVGLIFLTDTAPYV